ncbi:ComF family protein [Candidatus Gottesmanbacteria bacterium]|nr:ComF family protein [Candidatus Gottesmanbacteria bacterium]
MIQGGIFVGILDLLFPKRCVGCGKIGNYFCTRCISSIKIIRANEAICPVCEKPAIDGATHPGCKTRYCLDGLTSFFRYDGVVRQAVKAIKYRYISDLAKEFISLIPPSSFEVTKLLSNQVTIFVPLPLHWLRLRDRGFNQAEALGRLLAGRLPAGEAGLHITLRIDILRRVKMTEPQVEMKKREDRLKNMEHVFGIPSHISVSQYPNILLFDDVFTTGATMRAAGETLKRAGAKSVWAVTMAR